MPTLQDVAKRAGVSIATVSKVLSNTPYFTEETRDRVMLAVRELGYMPNLAARALSSGKTHIIAVVFPYVYDAIFKDPLVMQVLEGIESVTSERGYNILLSTPRLTSDGPDDNYQQLIHSGYIEGLIAIDNVPLASVGKTAIERSIPSVVLGYAPARYSVRSDDHSGGEQLVRHVVDLGHQRVGVISVPETMNYAINERMSGVRAALGAANIDLHDRDTAYSDFSSEGGYHACAELNVRERGMTAIICLNDRAAFGAIQYLKEQGMRVPEDVSVVGYDNIAASSIFTPHLTTIDQKASAQGQYATQMLFDILNGQSPDPVVVPVELITRSSTAPCIAMMKD